MIDEKYLRNRIYLSDKDQIRIAHIRILIGGLGLGSVIAECALRMGFKKLLLVDGDHIEETNLNRQNYTYEDIGKPKAESIFTRLMAINPQANIQYLPAFLDGKNVAPLLDHVDIAINAFDFKTDFPFVFDDLCVNRNIPVLHPYNFGWAGLVAVVNSPESDLRVLSPDFHDFELTFAKYINKQLQFKGVDCSELERIIGEVITENGQFPPPQLSVGSWITAGMCTRILFRLTTGKEVKQFPEFYYLSTY